MKRTEGIIWLVIREIGRAYGMAPYMIASAYPDRSFIEVLEHVPFFPRRLFAAELVPRPASKSTTVLWAQWFSEYERPENEGGYCLFEGDIPLLWTVVGLPGENRLRVLLERPLAGHPALRPRPEPDR